jgi:hypothetical protein
MFFKIACENIKFGCICKVWVFIPEIVIAIALHRLKEITLLDKTVILEALQSLKQLKKLRHPYSKALAQVRFSVTCLSSNFISKFILHLQCT